jgi:hypothetical protein
VEIAEPFRLAEAAPEGSTLYCLIPNSNARYHAQLAVGVDDGDLPALFPGEVDAKLRLDGLGELANVVAGLILSDEGFMGSFGRLKPSTPFFSEGAFTDRRDVGIRGAVRAGGIRLGFHITIRPAVGETWSAAGDGGNRG